MKKMMLGGIFVILVVVALFNVMKTKDNSLIFVCHVENDLYNALMESGKKYERVESDDEAIEKAVDGSAILILADNYPQQKVKVPETFFDQAKNKNLRVYIEYPDRVPGLKTAPVRKIEKERGVITTDVFGESLQKMRIVMIHDCHFVPVNAQDPYIVMAKVAGFDTALFGLDSTETFPILYEYPGSNIFVSTTKLSHFITGRYSPKDAWKPIWEFIFSRLQPEKKAPEFDWTETVRPTFRANERITKKNRLQAVRRGIDWYYNSAMLSTAFDKDIQKIEDTGSKKISDPNIYGKNGIYECFSSKINYDGSQPVVKSRRADCASEASMAISMKSFLTPNQRDKNTATNLQDYVYLNSSLQHGPRGRDSSPSFGFVDWFTREDDNKGVYYSDDNARVILGTLVASAALKTERWNEGMLKAILANFRTTGPAGFKPRRLEEPDLQKLGWEHYWKDEYVHFAPHYQSWIWATFLWLYDKTKYKPLLDRSKIGIKNMMAAYPDEWHWTNGLQQERARMILPLAWLLRIEDTTEHRKWLYHIVDDLLAFQDESGAIREDLGSVGFGKYAPPKSNAAYGTNEAPLIQENGDPLADMLYTSNFAIFSLTEAAAATGDERIKSAARKLADFLVRIQVRSESHPELDGSWYRAFDFKRWEYWGSNADAGWGVWSTETGWTQGWIVTMQIMNEINSTVWDFTADSKISNHFEMIQKRMLPERIFK
jgi:hypothetical protein